MENFSIQSNFDPTSFWAKSFFPTHTQSFHCNSASTTLSQASQQSPSCFDLESEENDYFRFPLNSPIYEADLDESLPEESTYAHNGSFQDNLEDDFDDLLTQEIFLDGEEGYAKMEDEMFSHGSYKKTKVQRLAKNKERKAFGEGWDMIKNIFLRYMGSSTAITIIKHEMNCHEILWRIGFKNLYRELRREAKKMLKNNVAKFPQEQKNNCEEGEALIWELLRKLYFHFLNEKAEFLIRGLNNISENMKELMLEIIYSISI